MHNYIDQQFNKVIKQYDPTGIQDLIGKSHCNLYYANLDEETGGCTVTNNRCHTIIINDNWEEAYQKFVILHEFSHVKLHKGVNAPFFRSLALDRFISKTEREANEMALRLLLYVNKDSLNGLTKYQKLDYLGLPYKFERFLAVEY